MERWLKAADVVAADPVKEDAQAVAVKAEMARVWDTVGTRDDMMKHIECWLAGATWTDHAGNAHSHGLAPVGVRGCVPRERLYPIMEEVYKEKYPDDFPKFEEVTPVEGGLEDIG